MNCVNDRTMAAMATALAANPNLSTDKSEMRLYLDRLKAMVPQCPKNRKVSRQEVLEHVINYISDLQDTLDSDSDSEDESPLGSPMDDVSFNDAFNQQPQYSGYGVLPQQPQQHQKYYSSVDVSAFSHQPANIYQHCDPIDNSVYGDAACNNFRSGFNDVSAYSREYTGNGYTYAGFSSNAYSSSSYNMN